MGNVTSMRHGDEKGEYTLIFKTGDMKYAGTDANVFVTFRGTNGESEELGMPRQSMETNNPFKQGQIDTFKGIKSAKDFGVLKELVVRHDNTGDGPGWYLDWVMVYQDWPRKKSWKFTFNQWLSLNDSPYETLAVRKPEPPPGGPEDPTELVLRSYDAPAVSPYLTGVGNCCTYTEYGSHVCSQDKAPSDRICAWSTSSKCHDDETVWESGITSNDRCWERDGVQRDNYCGKTPIQRCAKIAHQDSRVCPYLGDEKKVKAVKGKAVTPGVYDAMRHIRCQYSLDDLAHNCEAAREWTERRREDLADEEGRIDGKPKEQWFHLELMRKLCANRADPELCTAHIQYKDFKGDGKPLCANMIGCELCRDWAKLAPQDFAAQDVVIDSWCSKHGPAKPPTGKIEDMGDPACRCTYAEENLHFTTSDHTALMSLPCWYVPCQDTEFNAYMAPSSRRWNTPNCAQCTCPTNVCTVAFDIENVPEAEIYNIFVDQKCGEQPKPDPDPPGPDPDPKPDPQDDKKKKALVIAGAATLGIGVLLVVGSLVIKKKK